MRSIVFRTAISAALLCGLVCAGVFFALFQTQKRIYEANLVHDSQESIERVAKILLGYFYSQANWVYLEDQQKLLNKGPNVLYNYITNSKGQIDLGLEGFQSSEVGSTKQTWEPEEVQTVSGGQTSQFSFVADSELAERFKGRLNVGDRVLLISSPIGCLTGEATCGYMRVAVTFESIQKPLKTLQWTFLLCGLLITLTTALVVFFVSRWNLSPVRIISQRMRNVARQLASPNPNGVPTLKWEAVPGPQSEETVYFKESLEQFTSALQRASQMESELRTTKSLNELATHVAHDIRAPLMALEVAVESSLPHMEEQSRNLLQGAITRIRDIAQNLLSGYRSLRTEPAISSPSPEVDTTPTHLLSLLHQVVDEKRGQYSSRSEIRLALDNPEILEEAFVKVGALGLSRALSNLIDNAAEAVAGGGSVTIKVHPESARLRIQITDTGPGMPPEILQKLGTEGFTFGKAQGTGLGVYSAKSLVISVGGEFKVTSEVGKGTEVSLWLPATGIGKKPKAEKAPAKQTPTPQAHSPAKPDAVLIDDDPLVCAGWETRGKESGKNIRTFASPDLFRKEASHFAADLPIFVDSSLGDSIKGEEVTLSLYEVGFVNVYLSTGYPPSYFEPMPWLKGIVGKEPPDWLLEKKKV